MSYLTTFRDEQYKDIKSDIASPNQEPKGKRPSILKSFSEVVYVHNAHKHSNC